MSSCCRELATRYVLVDVDCRVNVLSLRKVLKLPNMLSALARDDHHVTIVQVDTLVTLVRADEAVLNL